MISGEVEASEPRRLELSIVMPCLDEAATVGSCVRKARDYLQRSGVEGEVVVVDNGSSDGSPVIAAEAGARVVPAPRRGYGNALMAGIEAARGRYIIMGDADDSYDFERLDPFLEKLRDGYELVMGNRFAGGIERGAMPLVHRYFGNPALSFLGRLFFGSPVRDFQCGLRGFRRDSVLGLGLSTGGMEFASEMVVKSALRNLRVAEVPTTLSRDGRDRAPHLRTWRDGWRYLRFMLLFSPQWLFLYPGLLLMLVGVAGMSWLVAGGPQRIGDVGLDVNTLVYTGAAIVVGFQLVVFALFAKVFAIDAGLLPEEPKVEALRKLLRLEWGLLAGILLVVAGLAASGYAVGFWGRASFGPLDTRVSLRIVIPAATALVLGLQVASSSFFLSVLDLKGRMRP